MKLQGNLWGCQPLRQQKKIKLNQNLREIIAQERKAFNDWKCGKKEDRQNWKTAYRTILKEKRKEVRKLEKRTEQANNRN